MFLHGSAEGLVSNSIEGIMLDGLAVHLPDQIEGDFAFTEAANLSLGAETFIRLDKVGLQLIVAECDRGLLFDLGQRGDGDFQWRALLGI